MAGYLPLEQRPWHVLRDKQSGKIGIYYIDTPDPEFFMSEFDEDITQKEELSLEQWPSSITREVLEGMLEDRNYHRFVELPTIIEESLAGPNISAHIRDEIMANVLVGLIKRGLV